MASKKTNYFTELDRVDVTKDIKQKGRFNYLSWAYAVRELKKRHPEATWTIHEYGEKCVPFVSTECGYFVKVTVHVDGVDMTQVHPVLNHENKPIPAPNAFQINTSIQRCLAKAIALHGLGIHIFANEDLPAIPPLDSLQEKELIDLLIDKKVEENLLNKVKKQIKDETLNQGNFLQAMEHYQKA